MRSATSPALRRIFGLDQWGELIEGQVSCHVFCRPGRNTGKKGRDYSKKPLKAGFCCLVGLFG